MTAFMFAEKTEATLEGTIWEGYTCYLSEPGGDFDCRPGAVEFLDGQVMVHDEITGMVFITDYYEWECGAEDCFLANYEETGWFLAPFRIYAFIVGHASDQSITATGFAGLELGALDFSAYVYVTGEPVATE